MVPSMPYFGGGINPPLILSPFHGAFLVFGNMEAQCPARVHIVSDALAWAEVLGSQDIFIGVNALDYSRYSDWRPESIAAFERMANLAAKAGVERKHKLKIHAPLGQMTKTQIIGKGLELGVDYSLTHSCYDPSETGEACGQCDSCLLRLNGFREAGISDPIKYRPGTLSIKADNIAPGG